MMKSEDAPLILSFCNWNYSKVALNWVAYLEKLGITNYLIVSLDSETKNFLDENNINTKLMEGHIPRRAGKGWKWRLQQTYDFLKSGTNIIHSDLDAVWLKNPLHLLDEESDIIASVDRGPEDEFCVSLGLEDRLDTLNPYMIHFCEHKSRIFHPKNKIARMRSYGCYYVPE